ncbi:ketoacyl-ACP synthase III [Shewanella sp. SR43-4]|jgi:3-oxoacyl-[acyl-carrier-protein] synthase-3|uniref:beta-ketoacyl-ACP synthase III n=1 Tax=Shewanella TaxID=22 RepID=UPI000C5ADBB2|nr:MULTISPECIES: beta-ketoacyl-ACP synthase III [Shewanella]NCQ43519.1 ketoacyl-ACP synthase III [Shewanella frigidimarina]MBB1316527.1 ketoacyl-ACP synthase III [Shewanella sp. SR43-4]MBB1320708.1 ketoacyl-ACP synthase III [Shewanella sp. SR43-8]MBB1391095.1 ketoacyl-ACP synthase III [Shewanella sp. SG44-6]MBB1477278.1 ketoacyl-ACP synthase III [Shewanella sp. SG41-3]|tara:strand:+ start:193 stop:1152 length:960 start_codon:yes stop_codon:yes gene_type:complete
MHTKILGTGSYLPVQVRSNQDLEKMVETSDQWIVDRTGISERRIAATDESVSTMGYQAALKALEMAGIEASDLDMIVCGTTSASNAFPAAACEIQALLGVKNIPAFDIAAACSGFIYALSVADQFVKNGSAKKVLVIGSDVLSRMCDPSDRSTVILFGDGAGAAIIGVSDTPGIIATHIYADGSQGDLLKCSFPPRANESSTAVGFMTMKGNDVFKVAVTQLSNVVTETLRLNNVDKSEIDWLVPHQANFRIINATAKKLNMSLDKVVLTLARHGNTSAASVPIALDEAVRDGRIQRGQLLLLEAFGGGFAWGSALIRF